MAIINGFDNFDDNISSSGITRNDTLFSSTYGGNDIVNIFSPHYDVHLGDGNDVLAGGIGGMAYGEAGNDRLDAVLWEGTHAHYGGSGDDRFNIYYGGTDATYTGSGGRGNDRFYDASSGPASVTFDGGEGFDVVTHTGATALSLTLGGTGTQGAATKSYTAIEGVVGAVGNDTMTGSRADNLMVGGNGSDRVAGGQGDDFLIGEGRGSSFVSAYMGLNINFSVADAFDPLNGNVSGTYSEDDGLSTACLAASAMTCCRGAMAAMCWTAARAMTGSAICPRPNTCRLR